MVRRCPTLIRMKEADGKGEKTSINAFMQRKVKLSNKENTVLMRKT